MPAPAKVALRGLHLHFDPVSGIAGDMTVAALVDGGVPAAAVSEAVAAVGIRGLGVSFESRKRGAFLGRGFVVTMPKTTAARTTGRGRAPRSLARRGGDRLGRDLANDHDHDHGHGHSRPHGHARSHERGAPVAARGHGHRDYAEIRRLLRRAKLDPDARALAEEIFARLAEVEAALHGTSVDAVTFHEVGAFDSIADVVGAAAAIAWLSPASIGSGAPVVGSGTVRTAHGIVPVPAPATAALLRGVAIRVEGDGELTTPTGAAILASIVDQFGAPPPMRIAAIGYGAGTRELADRPNVLRVLIGEPVGRLLEPSAGEVLLLEANIDDMSGQLVAALLEALFAAGALDAWATAILMKKGRPAQQISALTDPARAPLVERAFFLNSTTLGIRKRPIARATLARSMAEAETAYGKIRIKIAGLDGEVIGAEPELEDCRRRARERDVPVRRVWTAASSVASALVMPPVPVPSSVKRRRATRRA